MDHKFPRRQRIRSKKTIARLFTEGRADFVYPLKIKYLLSPANDRYDGLSLLITVPKKVAKKAVHRNRIKRLIRESWRQNQGPLHRLCLQNHCSLHLALIFIGKTDISYQQLEKAIQNLLRKLSTQVQKQS